MAVRLHPTLLVLPMQVDDFHNLECYAVCSKTLFAHQLVPRACLTLLCPHAAHLTRTFLKLGSVSHAATGSRVLTLDCALWSL